ncbi:hypothetical protein CEN49_24260 [Fischerella thermalis CCMEE 5273]|nr:hypothetical protein CEN49_24260 [Fischerella thermalis CCMEE 5273]
MGTTSDISHVVKFASNGYARGKRHTFNEQNYLERAQGHVSDQYGNIRVYDLVVKSPSGHIIGIEVKSGKAIIEQKEKAKKLLEERFRPGVKKKDKHML